MAADALAHYWQMWVVIALVTTTLTLYATETAPMEAVSLGAAAFMVVFFHFFPVRDAHGVDALDAATLLAAFANPNLVAIMALLALGRMMFLAGSLDGFARAFAKLARARLAVALAVIFALAMALSAFINNTPVMVMFIPLLATMAGYNRTPVSRTMMPLSFACALGGMTTLFGSSTNLLASAAAESVGAAPLTLFALAPMGITLALAGGAYVVFVAPRLLPDRSGPADHGFARGEGAERAYLVQLAVHRGHPLDGAFIDEKGALEALPDFAIQTIERGRGRRCVNLEPMTNVRVRAGDAVVAEAAPAAILAALRRNPRLAARHESADESESGDFALLEAVVAPGSTLVGRNPEAGVAALEGDNPQFSCVALGVERRNRILRASIGGVILRPGDVLLLAGRRARLRELRGDRNLIPLNLSAALGAPARPRLAALTMAGTALFAASGLASLPVAAIVGLSAAALLRLLTPLEIARALDLRLFLLVGSSLMLAQALGATGGAGAIAAALAAPLADAPVLVALSGVFLVVALLTNLATNNAAAALAIPVAVGVAQSLGAPTAPFVIAATLAASCAFATPTGYQTNLLAMTAGHYRFSDFLRVGGPLVLLIWLVFTLAAPWAFDL